MDMALLDPCDEHRDEGSMPHAQRTNAPFLWTFLALPFSKSNGLHETPSPFIPALSPHAYNLPVPSRIHRQACRRDGTGAGGEGTT